MSEFVLVISLTAVLFSAITVIFSLAAYAKVVGMEKSTHRIQYAPLDGPSGEELVDKMKNTLYPEDEDHL